VAVLARVKVMRESSEPDRKLKFNVAPPTVLTTFGNPKPKPNDIKKSPSG
jgi:hypothetical protein